MARGDESNWYRDEGELVSVLKRGRGKRRLPEIAGYDDLRELSRGGQGAVYTATQRSTHRRVAIKVLLESAFHTTAGRRRFEREIELVAGLRHPNIVSVYDSGTTVDDVPFFVMEYIEGVPLDQFVDRQRPDAETIVRLFAQICDAVGYAHQRGVIHRDLKPGNILIDAAGRPHVLDFGIAKQHLAGQGITNTALTETGGFLGTFAFAAPEQLRGDPSLADTRTDVYALGVIMYAALTGEHPYPAEGPISEVIRAITEIEPQRPSLQQKRHEAKRAGGVAAAISDELDTIVLKTLEKQPERRYQSAVALKQDLERFLAGEPIEAKRDSSWYMLRKTLSRHKAPVAVAATFVLLIVGFGITMSFMYARAVSAEMQAKQRRVEAVAARQFAEQEADRAGRAARKADQINAFLRDMLAFADPRRAGRPDLTVREMLDAKSEEIDAQFASQPDVAAGAHLTVGNAYHGLGAYEPAESHLRRALQLLTKMLGERHPDVATAQNDLSAILRAAGKHAAAEPLLRSALATYRQTLSEEHPFITLTLTHLGGLLVELGDPAAAEPLYREALELNRRRLGNEPHEDIAFNLIHLAGLRKINGDLPGAENLYREALAIYTKIYGDKHGFVAYAMNDVALVRHARGDFEQAANIHRSVIELRRKLLGDEHPDTLTSKRNLAAAVKEAGDPEKARQMLVKVIAVAVRALPAGHWFVADARSDHGDCLARLRQFEAAETELLAAYDALNAALGATHLRTVEAVRRLAAVYADWGKPERAAEWRLKLP